MRRRSFLQTAIAAPAIASPGIAAPRFMAGWKDGLPQDFEVEITSMMQVAPVPGAVIGTLQGGKPGWIRPLGMRNLDTKEPMLADTVFEAASLSKQATAYAAFQLRAQGKLDFDAPLVSYVDDLTNPLAQKATIRNVLSHSSGFPNWRFEKDEALVPAFTPGSSFRYSGEGFYYLQRIIEKVTGRGFGESMSTLVFEPLKMSSTSMAWNPQWPERYAVPHNERGEARKKWDRVFRLFEEIASRRGVPVNAWKHADAVAAVKEIGDTPMPNWLYPNAASSMFTCASDYTKLLAAAMANPAFGEEQVRFRPALGWGLGWGLEHVNGRTYWWQWGDNGGFKNFVAAEAAAGNAIFVFTNGDAGARVYDRIVTHATGHDHPGLFWI